MHAVETERTPEGKTVPNEGTDFEIEADLVLLAIGFTGPVRDRFLKRWTSATPTGAPSAPRTASAPASPASSSPATPGAERRPDRLGHRRGPQGREAGGRVPDGREPATGIGFRLSNVEGTREGKP